jgi:hypothetical protein
MDVRHVCVLIMEIPPGAMEQEMSIMMSTITTMERIHGVIASERTENAIPFLVKGIFGATVTGSVNVVVVAKPRFEAILAGTEDKKIVFFCRDDKNGRVFRSSCHL